MWVYQMSFVPGFWDVGFYTLRIDENGKNYNVFSVIEQFTKRDHARQEVNFLNGGNDLIEVKGTVDIGTTGL